MISIGVQYEWVIPGPVYDRAYRIPFPWLSEEIPINSQLISPIHYIHCIPAIEYGLPERPFSLMMFPVN